MLAVQMPAERKRARSHFVIDNDGSRSELERGTRAVFEELRRRAARAALGRPASTLLLAAAETRDHPALNAIAARYTDAGLSVRRVAGSAAALDHALAKTATPPDAIVATAAAARAAEQAWERVGRPGVLAYLSDRKSTRLNSSHSQISYAFFCLKKKTPTSGVVNCVTC